MDKWRTRRSEKEHKEKKFSFFLTLFPPPNKRYVAHSFPTKLLSSTCSSSTRTPLYPPAANNNNKLVQFTRVVFLIVIVENLCVLVLHTRQKILDNTFSPLTSRICCSRERRTIYKSSVCENWKYHRTEEIEHKFCFEFFRFYKQWKFTGMSSYHRKCWESTFSSLEMRKKCVKMILCVFESLLTRVCWSSVKNSRWTSPNSSATRRPSTAAFP